MGEYTPGTPLPWNLNPGDETKIMAVHLTIARADCGGLSGIRVNTAEANAAYIVHACNLYPELLEAAQEALRALQSARAYIASKTGTSNQHRNDTIAQLEAAIAKATPDLDGEG